MSFILDYAKLKRMLTCSETMTRATQKKSRLEGRQQNTEQPQLPLNSRQEGRLAGLMLAPPYATARHVVRSWQVVEHHIVLPRECVWSTCARAEAAEA
jgi:hypothetical protein